MANVIRIKRRAAGGASGAPASLKTAEMAYNEQDNTLYYGFGNDGSGNATSIITIGGRGAYADLTTAQTLAGVKTFSSTIVGSINGNAATATALATGRTISITGDISYTSPSFDGSGNVTAAGTLATVNSNVGTYTKITINAKGLATAGATATHSELAAPTADVSWGGFKLTSLADPTSASDAATKQYVDNAVAGLDAKASVKAATTANIASLAGGAPNALDGVSLSANDRVLVKNQSTASQNGIYVVTTLGTGSNGTWSRASDMDAWTEVPNAYTWVEQGTSQSDSGWVCTSNAGGTIGSTAIDFVQFNGGSSYVAGAGMTLTGNTFDVVGTSNRITVNADSIDIASTYVGQTSITTLGTVTTGTWSGNIDNTTIDGGTF